jgi:hypothetical protein
LHFKCCDSNNLQEPAGAAAQINTITPPISGVALGKRPATDALSNTANNKMPRLTQVSL